MGRDYDKRTGRPLIDGRDNINLLSNQEVNAELAIAVSEPSRRASRLTALLRELDRRQRKPSCG